MGRRFSLVGAGRAGSALREALGDIGWLHTATYGRSDDLASAAQGVDLCVVATPDHAIAAVADDIRPGDAVLMHVSGATPLTVLGSHRAAGLHPLVSLVDPESGARALRAAWFAVAGDPIATDIAKALSGNYFEIRDSDRALYHAAAVIGSNHLVALLGQVDRVAAEIDIPLEAFLALVASSVDNVAEVGPVDALTGPASRGDDATIQRHREAIAQRLPDELAGYDAVLALAHKLVEQRNRRAD